MPDPRSQAPCHAWLVGVELPGMGIDANRPILVTVNEAYPPARVPVGQEPQICAAADRRTRPSQLERGHGELHDGTRTRLDAKRGARGVQHAVVGVTHREDARVVGEAQLREHLECPQRIASDGKTRRAVTANGNPADIFKQLLCAARILAELLGSHLVHEAMPVAVAGDFMSDAGYLSDKLREPIRHPAQDKKRSLAAGRAEKLQDFGGVPLYAALARAPLGRIQVLPKGADVVVVFQLDCESVLHSP